jgi:excisionase family DNA binding protein
MHTSTEKNELLVSEEAAQLLRISKASLWDKCRGQDPIPHIRLNSRTFRFRKSDLEQWLKERSR